MKMFLSIFFLSCLSSLSQSLAPKEKKSRLTVSGGAHSNFYQWQGVNHVPINIQTELLFAGKYALGLGYNYDSYKGSDYFFSTKIRPGYARHNISVRFKKYLDDPDKIFVVYTGCSLGISFWQMHEKDQSVFPTAQFLFGMKLKIYKGTFWINEFGIGPPYGYQSSIGIQF